ncbi:C40 family peptidase [Pseudomonas sp.]|uniref:C40 family peptidase n=1 Tax=Pseudomonas sp. TaxID=306 RepID=UPI0028ABCE62|nr:C40 family peptidase [Pseudomonas sp.]
MRRHLLSLLPVSLVLLLAACASQPEQPAGAALESGFVFSLPAELPEAEQPTADPTEQQLRELADEQSYQLPDLAESVLELGFKLVGTPYRYGGSSLKTGFDCSGFVGFLFRKEAGIELPRSTREMIALDAPKVARSDLEPGDVVFFNNRGRGRVSHAGIYIGNDRFIHSASRRSGGVRVDSLDEAYWRSSFMQAKRVLALAHDTGALPIHH